MNKKLRSLFLCALVLCFIIFPGIISLYAITNSANVKENRLSYKSNVYRSVELFETLVDTFQVKTEMYNNKEYFIYTDNFAGVYIDEQGFLNIGVVEEPQSENLALDGHILYRKFNFSYNYLQKIMNAIEAIMDDYSILAVGIDDKYNYVFVELVNEKDADDIIAFLQSENLYNEDSLNIICDPNGYNKDDADIAYGGDKIRSIFHGETTQVTGTIATNVICNITGRLGVVTNEHVARVTQNNITNDILDGSWSLIGDNGMRGQNGGTIDAAFIPFSYQEDWAVTSSARYNTITYTNIKLGNNNQIIRGQPMMKIGQTTGVTYGEITSTNVTFNSTSAIKTNTFRYTNASDRGDSGGPVYYDDGTNLYLLGVHMGSGYVFLGGIQGYACRITNIMDMLNVTPITNDSFNTTNLTGDKLRLNGLNFEPTGIFNLTDSIKGRHITTIKQFTFENHTFSEIHIPFSVTTIGSDAFKNTNNASIYLNGRTSVPSTFDINWNSLGNPVYLNGTLCTHASKTTIELNATQHGDLCNHCRTVTNKQNHRKYTSSEWEYCFDCSYSKYLGHTHSYTYTWLNLQEHKRSCSCGSSSTTPHIISGDWNGQGYTTCLVCGGPADSGIMLQGIDPTVNNVGLSFHISQYFGNGSYISNNGVIVLSELDLIKYYDGTLIIPYECEDSNCCYDQFDMNECCCNCNNYIDEFSINYFNSKRVDYLPSKREYYINISQ